MKNQIIITTWLLGVFIVSVGTFAYTPAAGQSPYLTQEQLTRIPKLLERAHNASEDDQKRAEELLQFADDKKTATKWGIATKAYGESAMVRPSVEALLGLSISTANIPRKRKKCIDEITAKLRDFSTAVDYMETAIAFSQNNDTDKKKILKHQKELLSAYERIVDKHINCYKSSTCRQQN